jgi:hypothetical protein
MDSPYYFVDTNTIWKIPQTLPTCYWIFMMSPVLKRRPLCKLITKTMVIQADGANLKFKDNLLGSLARLLPFDAIAALGDYPLHDKWTKTRVVQMR